MSGFFSRFDPATADGMQLAGLSSGLLGLGQGLVAAGQARPVGQPGPSMADAFGQFGQGQQVGLLNAYKSAQIAKQQQRAALFAEAQSKAPDDQISPQAREIRATLGALPQDVRGLAGVMDPEQLTGLAVQRATTQQRPMTAQEVAERGFKPGTVAYVNDFTGNPSIAQASDVRSPEAQLQHIQEKRAGLQPQITYQQIKDASGRVIAVQGSNGDFRYTTQPQEGFTLGPDQTRFGPDGRPIANGPPKPQDPFTLRPGDNRFGPDGKPIASVAAPAPEGMRFNAAGGLEPIPGYNAAKGGTAETLRIANAKPQDNLLTVNGTIYDVSSGTPRAVGRAPDARSMEAEQQAIRIAQGSLPPQQGYSLSPNQLRFSSDNKLVASGGPDKPNLPHGMQINQQTGQAEPIPGFSAANAAINAADPTKQAAGANTLRDEHTRLTADFRTVQDAYNKINMAGKTGQGDMALLYGYMKILDPGSVVRESEFATAARSGSLPESIQGWATKLINGERLPETVRTGFINEAKNVYAAQSASYANVQKYYRDLAVRQGLNPADVVVPFKFDGPTQARPGSRPPLSSFERQ